jgi:hypothetical protein
VATVEPLVLTQPFLHDSVSCLSAPVAALSAPDGQIRNGGVEGVFFHDRRVISELVVDVDGHLPVAIGHRLTAAGDATFVGIVRHVGDLSPDPTVRLERRRQTRHDGADEQLTLISAARSPIEVTIRARVAVDLAGVIDVKSGLHPSPRSPDHNGRNGWSWNDGQTTVAVRATGEPIVADGAISWRVALPARGRWRGGITIDVAQDGLVPNAFLPAIGGPGWDPVSVDGPSDLVAIVERGVGDVTALTLADPLAPDDVFVAGGSPWFFTLFGRDAVWAARLTLPLGTDLARGTLRTLARRQGTRHDAETGEAPGKILHEVRTSAAHSGLPPVYFGTVDATALWVCLLHDAWLWGLDSADVADLLDNLEAAIGWLTGDADSDGDGFIEYLDQSGRGLANQGWKDSGDAIQFVDGRIADPPIALSEAQAYAHEAAIDAARLLEAFGRAGSNELRAWAADLRRRFRARFWVSDARGSFPAIALDGAKEPVAMASSNLGHLLGTGLLDRDEAATVAARLREPDLDSGYGLRTMSADAIGFNPLGYHVGTIWPHDTVIAIRGLTAEGHGDVAASLAFGLLRAAPAFDHRLPELFAGTDARAAEPVVAYPASCRPQAWSAGVPVTLLESALALTADVPAGILRVRPQPEFGRWFPLRVGGLRVANQPLVVAVAGDGTASVETAAELDVDPGA